MDTITRNRKEPVYHQLYGILRAGIVDGTWQPGDKLPSETELIERHDVSRITARRALSELVQDGLIYREQGRGSFVAHPTIEQALVRIISFTEDMRRRGFEPGTRVLSADLRPAPAEIASKLGIDPGEELARLERLRLADGEPMSLEVSHLVHEQCRGVLGGDYANRPLREALLEEHDIRLVHATQIIRAITASDHLSKKLSIHEGAPLLYIERVTLSDLDVAIEYLQVYNRGDRYELHNELRG